MAKYDVHGVFEKLPEILGLELHRSGDKWQGGYYLNGEKHSFRRDKLKVHKWNGEIWISEEGGQSLSLPNWLQQYGGAADYWDAVRIIRGFKTPIVFEGSFRQKQQEVKYVGKDVWMAAKLYKLDGCPLFRWMAGIFGENDVKAVWDLYGVSTDGRGQAVYWYIDADGHICYDKRMVYKEDGHRDKEAGAYRRYVSSKGYNGKCFFGANVWGDKEKVYIVESEKTALLFYLYYRKPVMACGGKNNLREVDDRMVLVPDMDAREEWAQKGYVWQWWKNFSEVGDHWDIGDAIVKRLIK